MVTGNESINVKKRNNRGTEPLNIEKIHEMVEYACEDITGVSSSQVEMKSGLPVSYTHLTLPTKA